jgi:hypothetical protein
MQVLTSQSLLAAWERGMAKDNLPARALALLESASGSDSQLALARLPIGERDRRLLALREQAFGQRVAGVSVCPDCGITMEFELNVADVTISPDLTETETRQEVLHYNEYEITFHIPSSVDLAALKDLSAFEEKMGLLLERLIQRATRNRIAISVAQLPREVISAVEAQMAEVDPQADIQLSFHCQACGRLWQSCFDIASFLWTEVHVWALRLIRDVHSLAHAYGWREADILAMSSWRRQQYLELLSE